VKFTLGTYQATGPVSTAVAQVRISPVGAPNTKVSLATCIYKAKSHLYQCNVSAPVTAGAYLIQVWEKVGTQSGGGAIYAVAQNAVAVLGKPNANPERITVK